MLPYLTHALEFLAPTQQTLILALTMANPVL